MRKYASQCVDHSTTSKLVIYFLTMIHTVAHSGNNGNTYSNSLYIPLSEFHKMIKHTQTICW